MLSEKDQYVLDNLLQQREVILSKYDLQDGAEVELSPEDSAEIVKLQDAIVAIDPDFFTRKIEQEVTE